MINEKIVFKGTQDFIYKLNKRFIGMECPVKLIDGRGYRGELSLIAREDTIINMEYELAVHKEDKGSVCFDNFDIKHIIIFNGAVMIDFIKLKK
ncbi:MAG: hypothetical protein WC292_01575 [Clostridia bacterium]